ncbi:MAG: hypothetical protein ACKVX7_00835 [Planctomycetota bacterium]
MTASRDEVFLGLAVQLGFYSQEDGVKLLKYYREAAKPAERIDAFLLREGYIEKDACARIAEAIEHRAAGHVVDAAPRRAAAGPRGTKRQHAAHGHHHHGGGGGGHAHAHSHHHHKPPPVAPTDPKQIVMICLGGLALIGVFIFIFMELNKAETPIASGPSAAAKKRAEQERKEDAAKAGEEFKKKALPEKEPPPRELTGEELKILKAKAAGFRTDAYGKQKDNGPYDALTFLESKLAELVAQRAPESVLKVLEEARTDLKDALATAYDDLFKRYMTAKGAGKSDEMASLLADIQAQCGPEFRKKAEQ